MDIDGLCPEDTPEDSVEESDGEGEWWTGWSVTAVIDLDVGDEGLLVSFSVILLIIFWAFQLQARLSTEGSGLVYNGGEGVPIRVHWRPCSQSRPAEQIVTANAGTLTNAGFPSFRSTARIFTSVDPSC